MKKNKKNTKLSALIVGLVFIMSLSACSKNSSESSADGGYQKITPETAIEMMAEDENYYIVDVRTASEYAEGHIAGAILVPLDVLQSGDFSLLEDQEMTYYVYCRSGNRSKQASNILVDAGYTDVYDIGGISDWPNEIVTD